MDAVRTVARTLLSEDPRSLLLPSPVHGQECLRESIARYLFTRHVTVSGSDVFVLAGSQQGLDYAARLLFVPGIRSSLRTRPFSARSRSSGPPERVLGVPIDESGIRTDILDVVLQRYRPRLIYTLPTYQNPTGVTTSAERRRELLRLAWKYRIPIPEDDPYSDLSYDGTPPPSLFATDPSGHVLSLGSFSKTLFLGTRIGLTAPRAARSGRLLPHETVHRPAYEHAGAVLRPFPP